METFQEKAPLLPQWKICMPSQLWITKRIFTWMGEEDLHVNGGRSVVNIDAWNTKRCFQIQRNTPWKKLPYFMSGEKGEKWFPKKVSLTSNENNGIFLKQWKQWYLSQAMKTMKLTWNETITYNRARDGNTNAWVPFREMEFTWVARPKVPY